MDMANRIIEGLLIFQKYQDTEFFIGAEHEIIYSYATPKPLSSEDVGKLIELGWFQPDVEYSKEDEMCVADYDPEESWAIHP